MKKIVATLAAMFLFVVFIVLSAEAKEVVSLKNGVLIVSEVKEIKKISDVPEGISAEDAYKLVKGDLDKVVIKGEEEKVIFIFKFPIQVEKEYSDRVIKYKPIIGWSSLKIPRVETKSDFLLSAAMLISAILILIISMINRLSAKMKISRLFLFYVYIVAIIIIQAFLGSFLNEDAAGAAGILLGWLACIIEDKPLSRVLMGIAGVLAGIIASIFLSGRHGTIIPCFVFLIAVCLASLAIAYAGSFIKKGFQVQASPK